MKSLTRLAIAESALAMFAVASHVPEPVRAIAVLSESTPTWRSLLVAATGVPIVLDDPDLKSTYTAWLRRQPLAALVISDGSEADLVSALRRA
jgi:anti-sigma-K factor RskA